MISASSVLRSARYSGTRTGFVIGLGWGSFATSRAYQALRSSAAGDTWHGYDPLEPASPTNQTNLILALLLNPGRPNGGALARLADVAGWFGIDTVTPPAGAVTSPGIRLNTLTVDATWAYQPASDFPVTLEPVLRCELPVRVPADQPARRIHRPGQTA